jgi:hypothetical protein
MLVRGRLRVKASRQSSKNAIYVGQKHTKKKEMVYNGKLRVWKAAQYNQTL